MRVKAISIIALLALCACQPSPATNTSPERQALINDHPEKRFEQECWDAGHTDKSKAFYDCMGEHWTAWKKSNGMSFTDTTVGKYGQLRQQCLNTGYADHSQGYSDCMKERWQGRPDPVAKAEQDQQQVAASIKQCDQLFAARKLKSNYERGKCMNAAFEKYASAHPPADKAAFDTFQTDTLLIMVRLDKKEITNDEAQVLMRQSANKLVQADEAAIAQERQRQAVLEQQAYQAQVQQQQYENARSAAMTQGFLGILQNYTQQQQQRAYVPSPSVPRMPISTECRTDYFGTTRCETR